MTKLEWGLVSDRTYESGVNRGVLYPNSGPGVVWNGLVSVDESFAGGGRESFYYDGIKYLDFVASKNFQATITAFSTPLEFAPCLGLAMVKPGFYLTRQPRQRFSFSYQTGIADDLGYKIHLVYNATASQNQKGHASLGDTNDPSAFTWQIDAVPPSSSTFRPSAHFIVDSRKTDPHALMDLEDRLYGSDKFDPGMPTQPDLIRILNNYITEPLTEPI